MGAPLGLAAASAPPFTDASANASSTMAATSPSWVGTSSSSSTSPLHHPHYNLLANIMFDAIYYFPMIYYAVMSCVEWLLIHCNGDIVCFDGCIHVFIFYDGLIFWCMSARICWGDCIGLSQLDWLGGGLLNDRNMSLKLNSIHTWG
jgi:hypothetical protein